MTTATADQTKLARVIADVLQVRGGCGGWLYSAAGKPICQGWFAFTLMAVRGGWIQSRPTSATRINSRTTVSGLVICWQKATRALRAT